MTRVATLHFDTHSCKHKLNVRYRLCLVVLLVLPLEGAVNTLNVLGMTISGALIVHYKLLIHMF